VVEASSSTPEIRTSAIARLCAGHGPHGGPVAVRLVEEVLVRRTWAIHRHVHLVRAFEEAMVGGGIATALSIGCGAGLSELFLASQHPEIQFHLTDFDQCLLDIGRQRAADLDIANVTFGSLDLLASVGPERYDWVSSIEVLEHIEDDTRAAHNLVELTDRWFWILVPQCSTFDLTSPRRIARAWEQCGHHRPGYTPVTLEDAIGGTADVQWMRSCYLQPEAGALRERMQHLSNEEIIEQQGDLIDEACVDLYGPDTAHGDGIEVLGRVDRLAAPPA